MRACVSAAIAVAIASAQAGAETRPHYQGVVEGTLLGAPATFDPVAASTHAELTVAELMFDTLYRMSATGNVHPHLATSPPIAIAGAARPTVHIPLRRGVRFHDGTPLTPADVVASLERVRTTTRWQLAAVTAIRATGDEIEIETAASVDLATLLALPVTGITKGGRAPAAGNPIGSGPFAFESIDRTHGKLALKAFEDHFAGRVYIDRLALHWFDAGTAEAHQYEIDGVQISARGTTEFSGATPKFHADDVEGPISLLVYVGFGGGHAAVTNDADFRHALDLALVRSALSGTTSGEHVAPTNVPVPEGAGTPAMSPATAAGNLSAAQAALVAAAARVPALEAARLPSLKLEILVEDTRPDDRDIALRVARALSQLGIASTITQLPAQQLAGRITAGTADLWIGQAAAPVMMAPLWWGTAFAAGRDDSLVRVFASGRFNAAAAKKLFDARLPIVPLLFRSLKLWHRTDVRGLAFDASGVPCFAELFLFGKPKGRP